MDPELEKLVAEGRKNGYSDAEIYQILKANGVQGLGESPGSLSDLGRSAVQGATFGFGDEILGKLPEWMGGGEKARDIMRSRDKAFHAEHPIIAGGAEIAGGLAIPVGGAAKIGKGALNVTRAIGKGALLGGIMGGLSGAGHAEGDLGDRVNAAIPAAGAGAVLGGAIPGVAAGLRAGFNPAQRALSRLRKAVEASGGEEAVITRAREFEGAGRGQEATLADMSRPLQHATDFSANNSDDARVVLENAFEPRATEVNSRIEDDVRRTLGSPHAEQIQDDLAKARLDWADSPAGFQGLRDQNPVVMPVMGERFDKLLHEPPVKDALAQAREIGLIGPIPSANGASFEVLQGVKERLDTGVGRAFATPGARDLAVRLRAARDQFVDLLGEAVPEYRDRLSTYHKLYKLEEMVDAGRSAYRNTDARGLKPFLDKLSPEEVNRFREGIVSEMLADLRKQNAGAPAVRGIVMPGRNKKEIMEAAFGSRQHLEDFLKRQRTEIDMATTGRALGGSQTHARDMATVDPAGLAIDMATGGVGSALSNGFRSFSPKWLASRTAREMAPTLATQGSSAIERLMRQWQQRPPVNLDPMRQTGASAFGGLLGEEFMRGGDQ